jgi:hypothetical protein
MFHQRNIGLTCLKVQVMGVAGVSGFGLVLDVSARLSAEGEKGSFAADFNAAGKGKGFAAFRLLRQTQDGVNVDGAELAGVRLHLFDKEANHALAHGLRGAA